MPPGFEPEEPGSDVSLPELPLAWLSLPAPTECKLAAAPCRGETNSLFCKPLTVVGAFDFGAKKSACGWEAVELTLDDVVGGLASLALGVGTKAVAMRFML